MQKFWVHHEKDSVGVAVDDIASGEEVSGRYMDSGRGVRVRSREPIPLGHKIAIRKIGKGEKVIEYAEVVGEATAEIGPGSHVHVHNVRSLRWRR